MLIDRRQATQCASHMLADVVMYQWICFIQLWHFHLSAIRMISSGHGRSNGCDYEPFVVWHVWLINTVTEPSVHIGSQRHSDSTAGIASCCCCVVPGIGSSARTRHQSCLLASCNSCFRQHCISGIAGMAPWPWNKVHLWKLRPCQVVVPTANWWLRWMDA